MTTFDAPSREVCTIRRIRTNTPLQALVTLNDPVYVEAAQALARIAYSQKELNLKEKISLIFRQALSRLPDEDELAQLEKLYQRAHEQFKSTPEEAKLLATDPLGPAPDGTDYTELAAWTALSNVLLNLDETLSIN